ncbi:MAG TPA: class III extradiol ring-cleavage dioxygenase [Steroidobacteraceae bacterium]|nr:class III extradiol ring-cleavage dioxygenase [Steroidobacteraceae bacterium]
MTHALPTIYLTHGGGPCFWITFPEPFGAHAYDGLRDYLAGLLRTLPERPRAILMVTAHWEEPVPTVSIAAAPGMLYDYYGFPPHTYELKYPARGSPELGARVKALLERARLAVATDDQRGFDHGVFVPMLIIDPQASIPLLMMSLAEDLDPARHLAVGAALAGLRAEGVLIIGSGSSFHNMRTIFDGAIHESVQFDDWLHETLADVAPAERTARLIDWSRAPGARACHPRAEHLLPLMVAVGAAGQDAGRATFRDRIGGKAYSCFSFG